MELIKQGIRPLPAGSPPEPALRDDGRPEPGKPVRSTPRERSPLRARTLALLQRLRAAAATTQAGAACSAPPVSPSAPARDAADLNRVHLTGTLGSEPLLYDVGDHAVAALTLACARRWRTAAGAMEHETIWLNLTAWEALAEQCGRLLHCGDHLYVEGKLHLGTDQHVAQRAAYPLIVLDRIVLLRASPHRAVSCAPMPDGGHPSHTTITRHATGASDVSPMCE